MIQLIVIIKPIIRISGFDLYNTIFISSQLCLKCRRLVKKRAVVLALILVMSDCVARHWLSTLSKLNMMYEFDSLNRTTDFLFLEKAPITFFAPP